MAERYDLQPTLSAWLGALEFVSDSKVPGKTLGAAASAKDFAGSLSIQFYAGRASPPPTGLRASRTRPFYDPNPY